MMVMTMNKVWILYGIDAHDTTTLGVFDSERKARRAREYAEVNGYAYLTITEHEVK